MKKEYKTKGPTPIPTPKKITGVPKQVAHAKFTRKAI
jgi:hypothetical protein